MNFVPPQSPSQQSGNRHVFAFTEVLEWARVFTLYPRIDKEWLEECYLHYFSSEDVFAFVKSEDDRIDHQKLLQSMHLQFLASDLADSTEPGTGFESAHLLINLASRRLTSPRRILVQLMQVTFETQVTRIGKVELVLSDGAFTVKAVMHEPFPKGFDIEHVKIGSKMFLSQPLVDEEDRVFILGPESVEIEESALQGHLELDCITKCTITCNPKYWKFNGT